MKHYKLIKEYPNGPKLGTIINSREYYWAYDSKTVVGIVVFLNPSHPKDHPEYWQEIVEKDYEILSFVNNGSANGLKGFVVPLQEDGFYYAKGYPKSENNPDESLEGCLKESFLDIHSIRRISDGEIFTIGDETELTGKIKYFSIVNEQRLKTLSFGFKDGTDLLEFIKKKKQPLFTTEDGVDIHFNNKFWRLKFDGLTELQVTNLKYELDFLTDGSKLFSTKEKAKEYIDFNKIQYSRKDIFNIIHKGFDKKSSYAQGKHKVLAMFDIGPLPSKQQKLFTIEDINSILDKHFQEWNSSTMIDRQVLLELLKQK